MKKTYFTPETDIVRFTLAPLLAGSGPETTDKDADDDGDGNYKDPLGRYGDAFDD